MTNEEFKSWINGYITLSSDQFFCEKQYFIIKNHANLVIAMNNVLEPSIDRFLLYLDTIFKNKNYISFNTFQKYAIDLLGNKI